MQEKLLLNQARNVDAGKSNTTMVVNLSGRKDIIVDDAFNDVINEYNVYLDERENCTKIRLSADVNLIATNIAFNSITEIVKDEGSNKCRCLNYQPTTINSTVGKSSGYTWGNSITDAVMDTQITWDGKDDKNYTYLCGMDIFNNHILRSRSKCASYFNNGQQYGENFNTIDETLTSVYGFLTNKQYIINGTGIQYTKRYTRENTYSFLDSINVNLKEDGGWLGFLNKPQMLVNGLSGENYYGTDRVLNNQFANRFIDLFPGRDRYSLLPHYNESKNRYEKNWECCLTYPYSSTTEHIPFINPKLDTLRIAFIDETEESDDGIHKCVVYSISKHGLNVDDTINVYRSSEDGMFDELVVGDVVVDSVIDDYVFTIITNDYICKNWVSVFDKNTLEEYNALHVGENEYRVEVNMTTQNGWYYDAVTNNWKNYPEGDIRFYTVFAINDFLNLDYERVAGNRGKKYFPFSRFADWFMNNLQGGGSSIDEVREAFNSLSASCEIYATKDENGNWIPDESCLTTTLNAIDELDLPLAAMYSTRPGENLVFHIEPLVYRINDEKYGDYESFLTQLAFIYLDKCGSSFNEDSANTLFLNSISEYDYYGAFDKYYELGDESFGELYNAIKAWYEDEIQDEDYRQLIINNVNDVEYKLIVIDSKEVLKRRLEQYFNNETVNEVYNLNSEYSPDGGHTTIKDTIENNYVAIDDGVLSSLGSKNLSFAKTVDGIQCKYYVRVFSRFPNFDFYDKTVSEDDIYSGNTGERPIDEYSKSEYEKQSTVSRIGFAKNVYGDDMCQIVYNDDIDIYAIRDNLGRPLTSIYLSFFKTNYGYKEWYYKRSDNEIPDYKNENVEWSRCFGALKCGFEYSPYIQLGYTPIGLGGDDGFGNIHFMNDVDNKLFVRGLNEDWLGGGRSKYNPSSYEYQNTDFDEIDFRSQKYFYGDFCCYSPSECLETVIQDCCNRFNSVQREIGGRKVDLYTNKFKIDEKNQPISVKYTYVNDFSNSSTLVYDNEPTKHPEGVYYHQNYEIPIRTFSENVTEFVPDMIKVIDFGSMQASEDVPETIIVTTSKETYYDMNARPWLYNRKTNEHYKCDIINVLDVNVLRLAPHGVSVNAIISGGSDSYYVYSKPETIPGYAEMIPKNSGILRWRELVQNGFEDVEGVITEYPFTNGCLYVNRNINIFLRRQDPFGLYGLSNRAIYYGVDVLMGEKNPYEDEAIFDDTFREDYIKC